MMSSAGGGCPSGPVDCGPVDLAQFAALAASGPSGATEDEVIHLTRRVATLEGELATLQAQMRNLLM